ncbi:MAG: hypothetical protein HQK53_16060 [Oligoflexia bacterium]|nr:hypothetical protein [Oligoflexia bacterium]
MYLDQDKEFWAVLVIYSPHLEITAGSGILSAGIIGNISNLLGFLVPSNWFNWKESKLMYAAERSSYVGILEDQVTDTEVIYYTIHRESREVVIYNYYANHLQELIAHIKANNIKANNTDSNDVGNKINKVSKVSDDDILLLENLLHEIKADAAYYSGIAIAMAYPEQGTIGIMPIDLPDLSRAIPHVLTKNEIEQIKSSSAQLLTLRYLIRAAHYARLSRTFNFLGARGVGRETGIGISLGLENLAEIRIVASEKRNLEIAMQESAAKIESFFRKTVDLHNSSIDVYREYEQAKIPNHALLYSILEKYATEGTIDAMKLISAIHWAIKFEIYHNFVQHAYLIAKSQIDRCLLNGYKYTKITGANIIPANQELNYWHDRLRIKENYGIDKDINRGLLNLENP